MLNDYGFLRAPRHQAFAALRKVLTPIAHHVSDLGQTQIAIMLLRWVGPLALAIASITNFLISSLRFMELGFLEGGLFSDFLVKITSEGCRLCA